MPDVLQTLEQSAASLFQADPNDRASLDRLQQTLVELSELLAAADQPLPSVVAVRSAQLLTASSGNAEASAAAALEIIGQGVTALQSVVRDGNDLAAVHFPPALLETSGSSEQAAVPAAPSPVAATAEESADAFADPELLAGFLAEAQEHLEAVDNQLLMLEQDPVNPEGLNAVFRAFHTIKGVAGFLGLDRITSIAHQAENHLDRARNHQLTLAGPAMDVTFASADALRRLVGELAGEIPDGKPLAKAEAASLIARLQAICNGAEEPAAVHTPAAASGDSAPADAPGAGQPASVNVAETLKVDRKRLDRLVDMIGELVIAESMVHQELKNSIGSAASSARNLQQLNKITRSLQELSLSLRMVPVRSTFQRMARLVRDVAKKLGKPVDFHTSGDDTELDKTVVDQISDPLLHMIRNSVDHGIESSIEPRLAAGKPANGQVHLRAFHQGGNIFIEIEDDGRGLDREKLLAKARQKGIVQDGDVLTDKQVYDLIFAPGFSTAEKVTDVSGRGVGMDVVRRNVEALRGAIELKSELGKGTCLTMRLPLTMAIIDGMVVRVCGHRYIIPMLSIVELIRPQAEQIATVRAQGEYLTIRDRHLPLVRLPRLFRHMDQNVENQIVIVVEDGRSHAGLLVDEVVGQQQAVIKSLGSRLENQPGISGGAVMPDGQVGLILDVPGLLELARKPAAG